MSCCNFNYCNPCPSYQPCCYISNVINIINSYQFSGNTVRATLSPGCCTKKFPSNKVGAMVSFCVTYRRCELCLKISDTSGHSSTFRFNPWFCPSGTVNAYSRKGGDGSTPNTLNWSTSGNTICVSISS